MEIGVMDNPSKSVYDEAVSCGNAGFDFLDLTIQDPNASNVDIAKMKQIFKSYGLAVVRPLSSYMHIQFRESEKLAIRNWSDVQRFFPLWQRPGSIQCQIFRLSGENLC